MRREDRRKVRVVRGTAKFQSAHQLVLDSGETIAFEKCVIAAGSDRALFRAVHGDPNRKGVGQVTKIGHERRACQGSSRT